MTDFSNTLNDSFDMLNGEKEVFKMFKSMVPNLMVKNVEETIKFYEEIIGFSTVASVPSKNGGLQFAILVKDEFNLMIQERNNFIEEYPCLNAEKFSPSISLYIQTSNLDALYDCMNEKNVVHVQMHTTFYGSKEFAVLDNNGYVLTFTEAKE